MSVIDVPQVGLNLPITELVKLGAVDSEIYSRVFFPNTVRQPSPSYAKALWEPLENPNARLVNLITWRGGMKTTTLRLFASKRIAYGISRTILVIGCSESDAIRSVTWLRNRVERNHLWRDTFGLKKGSKWEETQIEIEHPKFGPDHKIWVLAAGVSGSLRGINFDDYRPDLIIVDDPQTDETAATQVQREKLIDLIYGTVKNSLAPVSDEPNAKLAMAITPQHKEDISQQALGDDQWVSRVFPCWTKETMDLPTEKQISSWPERMPTETLRKDKIAALRRNKLSIFTREMECRLTSKETAQFKVSWLNIREPNTTPRGCYAVLAIDPTPPPSAAEMAKGLEKKDFECHYVWGRHEGGYHLLDYDRNRGHEPSWTLATAFRLARFHRVSRIVVDAVAYQKTLKWLLEQEMKRRGQYYSVVPIDDKMAKFARITNVIGGLASEGLLYIGPEHTIFASQFEEYGPTYTGIDDDLDASALALQDLANPFLEQIAAGGAMRYSEVEDLPMIRSCP